MTGRLPWFLAGLGVAASAGLSMLSVASAVGADVIQSFTGLSQGESRIFRVLVLAFVFISAASLIARLQRRPLGGALAALGGLAYLLGNAALALALSHGHVGDGREWFLFHFAPSLAMTSALISGVIVLVGALKHEQATLAQRKVLLWAAGSIMAPAILYVVLRAASAESIIRIGMTLPLLAIAAVLLLGVALSRPTPLRSRIQRWSGLAGATLTLMLGVL